MTIVTLIAGAALVYVYVGYPMLVVLAVRLRGERRVARADVTPPVSFVISAYNEAATIAAKLENTLAIDYPREAFDITVISDASTDDTDRIVSSYASRGVALARQSERGGKTAGLNREVPRLTGEIVVFSDANALYERGAVRALVRNFADSTVGCVTGEARYLPEGASSADVGERSYWSYEIQVKRAESALGSMVGGDGAIYAIRRALWRTLPDHAINDFLNPLQIVAAGWRAVYEPDAICYEATAGASHTEYRRRVRIVSRSWRAVFQAPGVLNPLRVGLFAWSLVSHKVLRWFSGAFLVLAAIGIIAALAPWIVRAPWIVISSVAVATAIVAVTARGRRLAGMAAYFAVIMTASLVGVVKGTFGRVSGVWVPPARQALVAPGFSRKKLDLVASGFSRKNGAGSRLPPEGGSHERTNAQPLSADRGVRR